METRVLLAALAGGFTHFLAGFIFYVHLFAGFFKANAGTASGVEKMPPELWALAIGSLVFGLLFALLFSRWAGITTLRGGLIGGAWVMLLFALGINFIMFGTSNLSNLTATIVDPLINATMGALMGGVIGLVLGYGVKK